MNNLNYTKSTSITFHSSSNPDRSFDLLADSPTAFFRSSVRLQSDFSMSAVGIRSDLYLPVYAGLIVANLVFTVIRALLFAFAGLAAAASIHRRMLRSVLHGEMAFFDKTPFGRILNRFSSDVGTIDDNLPFRLNILLAVLFGLLGSVVITCVALPAIVIICLPLIFLYSSVQRVYRAAARDLKRLASIARSPVYAHFSETVAGLIVIRGFQKEVDFRHISGDRLNDQTRCEVASLAASAWLNLRLQLIAVIVVSVVVIVALFGRIFEWTNVSTAGLAVIYALMLANLMTAAVGCLTDTEKDFVAVERCRELEQETPIEADVVPTVLVAPVNRQHHHYAQPFFSHPQENAFTSKVDDDWPLYGQVSFKNVYLTYPSMAPDSVGDKYSRFALANVNLEIQAGERIGIVGRSGSGKSSMLRVLFRLVNHMPGPVSTPEIAKIKCFNGATGLVTIDGADIRELPLQILRSRLLCLSQEPFLFSGTVRENLDPLGENADSVLIEMLSSKCHLVSSPEEAGHLLDTDVGETGRSLSAGQRQLLCLARALFRRPRPRIVCLDEATASLDSVSEENIHNILLSELPTSTVILVAHRLSAVSRFCSRVVVMSFGRVVEIGAPTTLARDPASMFAKMLLEQNLSCDFDG